MSSVKLNLQYGKARISYPLSLMLYFVQDLLVLLCHILPFSLILGSGFASEGSCGKGCCPRKVVGKLSYTFKYESDDDKAHGCQDNCLYTEDGGSGQLTCFKKGHLHTTCVNCKPLPGINIYRVTNNANVVFP